MKRLVKETEILERYDFVGYRDMPDKVTLAQLGKMATDPRNSGERRSARGFSPVEQFLDQFFENDGLLVTARRRKGGPIQAGVGLVNHPDEVSAVEFSLVLQNFASAKERAINRISLRTRLVEYMLFQYQESQLAFVEIPSEGNQRRRLGYTVEELTKVSGYQRLITCTNGRLEEVPGATGLKTMPSINFGPGLVAEPVMLIADNPFAGSYETGGNNYINSILYMRSDMSSLQESEFMGTLRNRHPHDDLRLGSRF